jgi:two-component system, chemotaxis family, chemotaxis protein CheY
MDEAPILVIDDDAAILDTVSEILAFEGYPILTATNGAEGLRCVEQAQPALILLDMRMPIMDGWEFARILKDRGITLPIVVMTAAQDARQWAQEIGATAFLAKPFELLDLVNIVERLRGAAGQTPAA